MFRSASILLATLFLCLTFQNTVHADFLMSAIQNVGKKIAAGQPEMQKPGQNQKMTYDWEKTKRVLNSDHSIVNYICSRYGFTQQAQEELAEINVDIHPENANTRDGGISGGWWDSQNLTVRLPTANEEGTIHELAHALYDKKLAQDPTFGKRILETTIKFANSELSDPSYAKAYEEAKTYVGENGKYLGGIDDKDHITEEDAKNCNNATEIFASFASFTMGQYDSGERTLPPELQEFYKDVFTGQETGEIYYQADSGDKILRTSAAPIQAERYFLKKLLGVPETGN